MILPLVLALQTQAAAPTVRQAVSRQDSIATARFIARVRREEQKFFFYWRFEWQKHRDLKPTDPRFFSMHCHFDDQVHPGDELHLITRLYSRKSMCPIWFQHQGIRADESATVDNGLPVKSRERIRQRRAEILRLLDSAAVLAPADAWVVGQRVRLNVDQRDFERAMYIAAKGCVSGPAYCALLEGYVHAGNGNRTAAEAAFEDAAEAMTAADRCRFLGIAIFLPDENRDVYEKRTCAERAEVDARFWWLADPLYMQPGNERLAVHLYRHTLILLHSSLTADHYFDWRVRYGGEATTEMIVRYGWPSVSFYHRQQDENHRGWMGGTDSGTNASREYFRPRYHTTPGYAVADDIALLRAVDLSDVAARWDPERMAFEEHWWPIEHFARAGSIGTLDYQAAQFRRTKGPLVALATDPRSYWLPASVLPRYTAALVAMSSPRDAARRADGPVAIRPTGAAILTLQTTPGLQVLSAEILETARDSSPAMRARFAITGFPALESMAANEIALSDPVLFAAPATDDSLPRGAPDAIERMLPSTDLRAPRRIGVFTEVYGVARGEAVELTLTVVSEDHPGFLRRLGSRVGIGNASGGAIVTRWQGQAGTASNVQMVGTVAVQSRSIVLNLSELNPGRYAIEISAARPGQSPALSRREFSVRR